MEEAVDLSYDRLLMNEYKMWAHRFKLIYVRFALTDLSYFI
jgi:hypothetical protein